MLCAVERTQSWIVVRSRLGGEASGVISGFYMSLKLHVSKRDEVVEETKAPGSGRALASPKTAGGVLRRFSS